MFGYNGREFGISLPKQPKCKVDRCRFHFLKIDCRCHNSFLLFCRLLVLSERTVASFRRHVAHLPCCLSIIPLGRPQHCYLLPCQQLSKKLIGQGHVGYTPKFCLSIVSDCFVVGLREIENNGYAKFWGVKKLHYGLCENGD